MTDKKFKNTFDEHVSLPTEESLLSVQIKDFKIRTVPLLVLNDMYQDAANLVQGEKYCGKALVFNLMVKMKYGWLHQGVHLENLIIMSLLAELAGWCATIGVLGGTIQCLLSCIGSNEEYWNYHKIIGMAKKKTERHTPQQKWQMSVCRKRVGRKANAKRVTDVTTTFCG